MKTKFRFTLMFAFMLVACDGAGLTTACNEAEFIDHFIVDVPVQQGTLLMPGTHFTKGWQVTNSGTCDWTTDYALEQISGPFVGEEEIVPLHDPIPAGTTTEILVRLTAPTDPGSYTVEWLLRNAEGETFGEGPNGDRPLTMDIVVADLSDGVVYDFSQVICLAEWHSNRATFLPCDGLDDEQGLQDGYVRLAKDGLIEIKPNNQRENWIAGFFPPITIQGGDHFMATVGCVDENPDCQLVFTLEAESHDGTRTTIGEPVEVSGTPPVDLDIDLSGLEGQEVRLILMASESGGRSLEAIGYWLNARLVR